ncbi:mitochondrial distribution and morphology protein family 31/32 [Gorgonomyces haynaldii]|nr:mitochondrial distribution and morphology protein family 31/32 [Gorgonomyces haynaldii]
MLRLRVLNRQLIKRWYQTPKMSAEEGARALRRARQALIQSTDGFWNRQVLRTRLFLMGQVRPMRFDDFLAMFSWIFVGNTLFVLVGTTSFMSVVLWLVNTLSFQEKFAEWISRLLTQSTGFQVKFESAIIPRWRDGMIRMGNVLIICNDSTWVEWQQKEFEKKGLKFDPKTVNNNWTYWDLQVESIDITVSLWRWMQGRGLVESAKLKGVRGTVDRKHITWDQSWQPKRRKAQFGDFDLESLTVDDLLVNVENPNFRPFSISVFRAELPRLRKQWMLYDIMCADSAVGILDNCLFSIHRPQTRDLGTSEMLSKKWQKIRHYKMNGLPIGHLNAQAVGPFSWLTRGTIDIDMHMMIPNTDESVDVLEILEEIASIRKKFDSMNQYPETFDMNKDTTTIRKFFKFRKYGFDHPPNAESPELLMLAKIDINDLKASVPLSAPQLSYMSSALIRPVVAFMNANKTRISLTGNVRMNVVFTLILGQL